MRLIINADDFGLSKSISDGIIEGIKKDYITSTSIMINMKYAEYAISKAIENNIDCIGLHINLTVGKPLIYNSNLVDNNGIFLYNKEQIENEKLTYEDVYNEIIAQIELVNKYSNGKIKIDHLDTHHYLGSNEKIRKAIIDIAKKYSIPIRNEFNCDVKRPDILCDDFTINNVSVDSLKQILHKYSKKDITIELVTHPGFIDEYTKTVTSYLGREEELNTLNQAKEQNLFDKVELISFKEL